MSIELNVEDYCQNCGDFDAEVHKYPIDRRIDDTSRDYRTVIVCTRKNRCAAIKRYLENLEAKKNANVC